MKTIGVVSHGIFHPSLAARWALFNNLRGLRAYKLHHFQNLEPLIKFPARFDGVVLYYHLKEIDSEQLDWLQHYVTGGGGILAIHSASASFKSCDGYARLLGGSFVGHGAVAPFEIRQVDCEPEVFGDVNPFVLKDELYHHSFVEGNTVHFTASEGGNPVPVVWTRQAGKGRVCYCMFGHRAEALMDANVRLIIADGLRWVCGGEEVDG